MLSNLPNPRDIQTSLREQLTGFHGIDWVQEIGSTNAALLELAQLDRQASVWPRLLGTHHQTQGQGRLGRPWHDTPGQALMFSCGFLIDSIANTTKNLQGLGPALGMRSAMCLRPHIKVPDELRVKWPNDLMIGHGKLAGILVQTRVRQTSLLVVVGMGVNLRANPAMSAALGREVAGLSDWLHSDLDWSRLIAQLATAWRETVSACAREGFAPFQQPFNDVDYLANQPINILEHGRIIDQGTARGLSPQGCLVLETANGHTAIMTGDVSVRLSNQAAFEKP